MTLPPGKNPYADRSPFEVLGVPRTVTTAELCAALEERIEEVDYSDLPDKVRIEKKAELKRLYESLKDSKSRVSVEIFFFDSSAGRRECRAMAEKHRKVSFDFSQVMQRVEDIMPAGPVVQNVEEKFREVNLAASVRIHTEGHRFAVAPEQEALESITFER